MRQKPVFKNTTKGRIQIVQQGIPIWLNPGDIIVGERFRAFVSLGLEEVGKDGLPQLTAAKPVIKDDKPEKSPIKVRKITVVDNVIVSDEVKVGPAPKKPAPKPEPVVEEVAPVVEEEELMPLVDSAAGPTGETLKAMLISELEGEEPELAIHLGEPDTDDEPIVVADDEPTSEEQEDPETHPYKCDVCGKGFASKRGVKSHRRTHSE